MDVSVISNHGNFVFDVKLPENATGTIYFFVIHGIAYMANLTNGTAHFNITNLTPGYHDSYFVYDGDDYFKSHHQDFNFTLIGIIIIPSVDTVFVAGAGENYTVTIASDKESIGEGYVVVLELVNGDIRKNYTLTTDDAGSVSLPINLAYAKNYTFNIYFDAQGNYSNGFASQNITVKGIETKLVTDYVGDVFNSTVFSYDDWTAKLVDANNNPISNVIVNVNFTGLNNKTVVYKIKSDSNGDVKLPLRLGFVGLYKISANFEGNSHYKSSSSNNISVNISKTNVTIIAKNITTTTKSGENYTIQLLTTNGKPINGAKVYINFLNKDGLGPVYKLKTDAEGKAFLPLNLAYVGNYDLIIFFNDTENYIEKVTKTTHVKVVKDEQVLATVKE